jgi:hypothetical protein
LIRSVADGGFGKIIRNLYNPKINRMTTAALFLTVLLSSAARAQKAVTGYAPVNGLKMYYEIYGKGEPVVLLHGSFMTITNNWQDMIAGLSKTRQVIAVEMQGAPTGYARRAWSDGCAATASSRRN